MKKLINSKIVKYLLVLCAGVAIGAIFYPTKNIEDKVKTEYQQKINEIESEKKSMQKKLSDELNKVTKEKTKLIIESSQKITRLTYQVKELQSKKKETFYKLIKPDGTIEEKRYSESEINETSQVVTQVREEFDRKVSQISERWQNVHRKRVSTLKKEFDRKESRYKNTISKLERQRKISINPKKYGVEIGYTSKDLYYGHINVDVFGPMFLGLHSQSNFSDEHLVGLGIGVRF